MPTLFLKYRPQNFSDIVGQKHTIATLKQAVKTEKVAHAYLFAGSRGTGKTSTARILSKALLASDSDGNADENSPLFAEITDGNCTDVIEIDAASNRGINEIRDLREKVRFAPNVADKKVYIIDEVHMLTREAFNALLKTLEEPPEHAYFVLATTEVHKIPDTILSRCQVFRFMRFTIEEIVQRLTQICEKEGISFEKEALMAIAENAEGGLRDAIGLLERIAAENNGNVTASNTESVLGGGSLLEITAWWQACMSGDREKAIMIVQKGEKEGLNPRSWGVKVLKMLRNLLLNEPMQADNAMLGIKLIQKALEGLKEHPMPYVPFEVATVWLCQRAKPVVPMQNKAVSVPVAVQKASVPLKQPISITKTAPVATKKPDSGFEWDNSPKQSEKSEKKSMPVPSAPKIDQKESSSASVVPNMNHTEGSPMGGAKLKATFADVVQNLDMPAFTKMSLKQMKPQWNDTTLVLVSTSQFHADKAQKPEVLAALKQKWAEKTGTVVDIRVVSEKQADEPAAKAEDFMNW